jgi:hypothetical protein
MKSEDATPLFTVMGCANEFPGLTSGDEWVCERRQQHQAWWEASLLSYPVELVRLGQGGGIEKLLCGRGAVEIAIATLSQRRERIGPVSGVEADQNLQLKRLGAGEIHGRDESAHDAHERNGGWLPQEEVSLHFVAFFAVSKASVHVLHLFRSPVFSWLVLSSVADTNAIKERPGTDRIGVGVGCRAGLTYDARCDGRKRSRGQAGTALEEVVHAGHALPGDGRVHRSDGGWEQPQHREGIGRIGLAAPLLPVVHAVVVRVGEIGRAVGG